LANDPRGASPTECAIIPKPPTETTWDQNLAYVRLRFNRRRTGHAAFRSLLGIGTTLRPLTYHMLIKPEPQG
jgi:hypothetical protein